jgi:hypothetical protein
MAHWRELERFIKGDERDPRNIFRLADDRWETWAYAANGRPSEAKSYRFLFVNLRSFLKPYAKWYCYRLLLGSAGKLGTGTRSFLFSLTAFDKYIIERGFKSLDDIAAPEIFSALWDAQVLPRTDEQGRHPASAVKRQEATRLFWRRLSAQFGSPQTVPRVAPYAKKKPVEFAADESKVIPVTVISQLVNKLALHRDQIVLLNRFNHLRLCVLVLMICLGRRSDEILAAPRGSGPDGTLDRYPMRGGPPEGALWFRFRPNKGGPSEYVYISPAWEDVVYYCVRELVRYGDEVRKFAAPEERDLLILISTWNWTTGAHAHDEAIPDSSQDLAQAVQDWRPVNRSRLMNKRATGLSNQAFGKWLNGGLDPHNPGKWKPGALQLWNITVDGTAGGAVYKLTTQYARHTRQSVLALDRKVSLLTRQRDLNHTDPNMQVAYQHHLTGQNEALKEKMQKGQLRGDGIKWLAEQVGTSGSDLGPEGS